jgi:virginiamycin A acetyltransferase
MKQSLKDLASMVSTILVSPLILLHMLAKLYCKDGIFVTASQFLSLLPGKFGSYLRVAFYRFTMTHCSPVSHISFSTIFSQTDTEIEEGVYIGAQCNIGMCRIGKDTMIASGVHIMSGSNQHRIDDIDTPMQQQGGEFRKVRIGEDCWLGNGALIMADIGKKSVIGAGSVVTSEIPEYSIVAGNPARVIRSRKDDDAESADS